MTINVMFFRFSGAISGLKKKCNSAEIQDIAPGNYKDASITRKLLGLRGYTGKIHPGRFPTLVFTLACLF
ncbi:hypothetical protein [Anabaena catenula]|uniref:Transposase n=1 Tax=Anabaena catenula FACHB-362 TaxID=2692877 RepID=A0ABR8J9A4_9NOST|nr:hypothetical protein [Anabaena catenula]MBD2694956.1 hypothetical protein [Anabaena catenula FACHB-362]